MRCVAGSAASVDSQTLVDPRYAGRLATPGGSRRYQIFHHGFCSSNCQNFHHGFMSLTDGASTDGGGSSSLAQNCHQALLRSAELLPFGKVSLSTRCASSRSCG